MDWSNVHQIFPTIAFQLTTSIPSSKSPISKVLKHDPSILDQPLHDQLQKLIIHPLLSLEEPLAIAMVIVIDALDECDDEALVKEMISLIAALLEDV